MKVLVLAPSLASAGGIQRYTLTLIRALKDELGEQSARCLSLPAHGDKSSRNGALPVWSKLSFGWQALSEQARWRPDLIICTHLALGPTAWGMARAGSRRYWIVVHGIEAWAALPRFKTSALRQADRVVVTNAFNEEQLLQRHPLDATRIATLPCTLDETLLTIEPSTNGPMRQISGEQPVVLTVGRMALSERYKGHDVVLRSLPFVLSKVLSFSYVIVGDGDDRARLEQLARDLDIADHVLFTGEISDCELAALYRRSNIFVLPARTVMDNHSPKGEGFGIVFLEAMAFGKPVVGPNYGAPADLIRHGDNGLLVDPEDPRSVGEALVRLLSNPDMASQMGKAGSDWVRVHYSYDCFRKQLRHMLNS